MQLAAAFLGILSAIRYSARYRPAHASHPCPDSVQQPDRSGHRRSARRHPAPAGSRAPGRGRAEEAAGETAVGEIRRAAAIEEDRDRDG